jgi:tRNA nucleotidyltransferase (CCA-adding enzyme)
LEKTLRTLGRVNTVGRSFGVFKLRPKDSNLSEEIDVSIPRRDSKDGPGHRGIKVAGDPFMSIEEAARRRDLTINAISYDLTSRQMLDPSGGIQDLEKRLLRAVDDTTFLEDPLRALRVAQFAARFDFHVDPALIQLCTTAALDELPAERVLGEWEKLLLKGARPSAGLAFARSANILQRVFPEAAPHDGPLVDQTLDALVSARSVHPQGGRRLALMLAGWLHTSPHASAEATLDRLRLHKRLGVPTRDLVLGVVALAPHDLDTDTDLRRGATQADLNLTFAVRAAAGRPRASAGRARAEQLGVLHAALPRLVLGRDLNALGMPAGPLMGHAIRALYERQLTGELTTKEKALAAARALISAEAGS